MQYNSRQQVYLSQSPQDNMTTAPRSVYARIHRRECWVWPLRAGGSRWQVRERDGREWQPLSDLLPDYINISWRELLPIRAKAFFKPSPPLPGAAGR